jgi:hypothetical protein
MSIDKKFLIIIMVLVIVLVGACDSDSTPNISIDSSEDGSANDGAEAFPTPEESDGALGSATITYGYLAEDPNFDLKLTASIPVTIERDPNNPGKYLVTGFNNATAYLKNAGIDKGVQCWMRCDYQPISYAIGTLTQNYTEGCIIKVKFSGDFLLSTPSKSGNCSEPVYGLFKCEPLIGSFLDEHEYTFTKEVPNDIPKESDNRKNREAKITNVNMSSLSIDEFCKWGEGWD